jgi:N-acetylglucosamine-6-phosphate deacetylase
MNRANHVTQTSGLPYRRLAACEALDDSTAVHESQAQPTGGRRYGRPEVCATTGETEVHAWNWMTRRPVRARAHGGVLHSFSETNDEPTQNLWLAPMLFDLQINGYAGIDFQQDDIGVDELRHAARALRRDGCGRFLLTLITEEWLRLLARLRRYAKLRQQDHELSQAISGFHIEGPFLSEKAGFHGAHNPAQMLNPTVAHMRELRGAAGELPLLVTLAPERDGALAAIAEAARLGIRVSLGHTDASAELLARAVGAGATAFTHLANGCPRELDRHDNIVWRVGDTPGLTVSLIPDAIHVSPAAFRVLHRALGERIYYTTDAMAAAGAPPGRYQIGATEVEVGADQIVRQPGRTNFAGSALRPVQGVFRAAQILQCDWQECWRRFSEVPARLLHCEFPSTGPFAWCLVEPEKARCASLNPF